MAASIALGCGGNLRTIVDDVRSKDIVSVRAIADELNARGILTPRDGAWHATSAGAHS